METPPVKGQWYTCKTCGMELVITADCKCEDCDDVKLECCGQPMVISAELWQK